MKVTTIDFDVDDLTARLKKILSDGYIFMMYECFLVIMDKYNYTSISTITPYKSTSNFISQPYNINWKKSIDDRIKRTHKNQNQTTDFGTMLLSLGIIEKIDKVKEQCKIKSFCFETSVTGTGIDFWISDEAAPLNFKARIEISGILSESKTNNLKYRSNVKTKQASKSSSSSIPVYISLVEFSKMEALVIKN